MASPLCGFAGGLEDKIFLRKLCDKLGTRVASLLRELLEVQGGSS